MKSGGKGLLMAIGMSPKKKPDLSDKGDSSDEPPESASDLSSSGDGDAEDMAGDDFIDAIAPDMDEGKRADAKDALRRYVQACIQKDKDGGYGGDDEEEEPTEK
jgi:hypothetical protein